MGREGMKSQEARREREREVVEAIRAKVGPHRPRGQTPPPPESKRHRIYERDGWRCIECEWKPGTPPAKGEPRRHLTLDHVIPRSKGGTGAMSNLVTLCNVCNREKGDRWPTQEELARVGRADNPERSSGFHRPRHGVAPQDTGDHYGGGVARRGKG